MPSTETGTFHGDLEGIHITAAHRPPSVRQPRAPQSPDRRIHRHRQRLRQRHLRRPGTEEATPTTGTGSGSIAVGFGTGGLAHLAGHYGGTGTAGPTGIHSSLSGNFTCTR